MFLLDRSRLAPRGDFLTRSVTSTVGEEGHSRNALVHGQPVDDFGKPPPPSVKYPTETVKFFYSRLAFDCRFPAGVDPVQILLPIDDSEASRKAVRFVVEVVD